MRRYRTILADPPWPEATEVVLRGSGRRRQHRGFSTMSYNDIDGLSVGKLALPDAHLYLWSTQRSLAHAFQTVGAWGFVFKSLLVWCKPLGTGLYYFRPSTEYLLFATRGQLRRTRCRSDGTWFRWPRGTHNGYAAKPNESYQLIERNSDGPYLELFARRRYSKRWDVWGDEIRSTVRLP